MELLLGIIAAAALFFLAVMAVDSNRFVIREYTCTSNKLRKDGDFILLSDLHGKSFGRDNERLLKTIEQLSPDVILIAGDMYTADRNEDNKKTAGFVSRLAAVYPVYYGNGNHEHKTRLDPDVFGDMYEKYMNEIIKAGAVVLINERVSLPAYGIELYGVELGREYYAKFFRKKMEETYLNGLLGQAPPDTFRLMIAHNPDYFAEYACWGADLVVSGHVHGGLMRLPILGGVISPSFKLFPHFDGGEFCEGKSRMILGRGLGSHTLPLRIFNPGELVVLHLRRG